MEKDQILLAKNLDWPIEDGLLLVNKRGLNKETFQAGGRTLRWKSKYGSITFNQFGKEFPLGGMNEAGLVVEELNSWGAPPKGDDLFTLNEFQWVQYLLDNFARVEEVLETDTLPVIAPLFINLHYLICDKDGKAAVIEFHEGKTHIYHGDQLPYPVLSNNHYQTSLKYLPHFQGFGGDKPIPKQNTSNERFLKVAGELKKNPEVDLVSRCFSILDKVKQEDTQWSIVYDVRKATIHFKTASAPSMRSIHLQKLDFSCPEPTRMLSVQTKHTGLLNEYFIPWSSEINSKLLQAVYQKYKWYALGKEEETFFLQLANFGNAFSCP